MKASVTYPMRFSYKINLERAETGRIYSFYLGSTDPGDFIYLTGFPDGRYTIKDYEAIGLTGNTTRTFDVSKISS